MQAVSRNETRYDSRTIWLHWITAVLIVAQWIGAKTIDMWPNGPLRIDARSAHITTGAVIGLLVLARILWRVTGGRRLPDANPGVLAVLAQAMHWGLYLLILCTVSLGLTLIALRGVNLFDLWLVPALLEGTRQSARAVRELHELLGTTILIAAALHAAAALIHYYAAHDGVLRRMVPGLRR